MSDHRAFADILDEGDYGASLAKSRLDGGPTGALGNFRQPFESRFALAGRAVATEPGSFP